MLESEREYACEKCAHKFKVVFFVWFCLRSNVQSFCIRFPKRDLDTQVSTSLSHTRHCVGEKPCYLRPSQINPLFSSFFYMTEI